MGAILRTNLPARGHPDLEDKHTRREIMPKKAAKASSGPSAPIAEMRGHVHCGPESVENASGLEYAGAMASTGDDNSFDADSFREGLRIDIISMDDDEMVFDMVGIDAPIANASRRILLAEVPTMAIEK